ncbi:hypothetical protein H2200_009133 [Cladophialophora chaetospira]|uniref:Uncharacterized protein n=1 Tax=Cladophialophora chaetospira TaxID=386627 RepID=A0AA39CFE8_9EURO|nr:hypothetical protein H2200_009133 [Cladophialophora chaetospira]
MAAVFDGLLSSRRRPARSQSESGKQLHARWGDASISAPNDGGWSQHYLDDDINNIVYQAHGSPDSQKTLVNDSPDLSYKDAFEKISIEEIRQPTPPLVQKERSAITFTIPLPWGRKSHRRSSSGSKHQAQAAQVVDRVITAESRPALNLTTSIDEVIVADPRAAAEPYRSVSPIVHTQSPVYNDVSTFFTRAVFPEKHGHRGLPQIQTQVPINKSQPASALSILSPVAEKYNGISESNNATPMDNTPIAQRINTAIPIGDDGVIDVSTLTERLEDFARYTPASVPLPPSRVTSPLQTPIERPDSRSTARFPSRPQSRGPGIGEVAYMRASSRGPTDGHRSSSRHAVGRRTPSAEPLRRRAMSRDAERRRADSPRGMSGRSYSRETVGARARSREPSLAELDGPRVGRDLSLEPVRPRAESPGPATRRAHSRAPSVRRDRSPVGFSRRAISREPVTRRRMSGEFARRAVSVDPIRRRASPRDDIIPRHATPLELLKNRNAETSDSSSADELTADDTTDIETETDEMYFESRKGWNGPAMKGADSKGFYGDVINDYKLIARDVEVTQTQTIAAKPRIELVNYIKKDKQESEKFREIKKYGGPDLVPDQEDLWG